MGKYCRSISMVAAQAREIRAAQADLRAGEEALAPRNVFQLKWAGDDFPRVPANVNRNNVAKRARLAKARAFKARRICAEFWDYNKL